MALNPNANTFVPSWLRRAEKRRYSRADLLKLRNVGNQRIRNSGVVDSPPFTRVPKSVLPLLALRNFQEFVDVDALSSLVSDLHPTNDLGNRYCLNCSRGPQPCPAVADAIDTVRTRLRSTRLGAFVQQGWLVVSTEVLLQLVFYSKVSKIALRGVAQRAPKVVQLVRSFLTGAEKPAVRTPAVTDHGEWNALMALLSFDAIRDNRTKLYTDISRNWIRSRTPFEQFAHFLYFCEARPIHPVRNMLINAQKPTMVAVLTQNSDAFVALADLGFLIPPDFYWDLPIFSPPPTNDVYVNECLRHLGVFFYQVQSRVKPTLVLPIQARK